MNKRELSTSLGINIRIFLLVCYLIVSLMMGSAAIVLTQLSQRVFPSLQFTYLPGICVFVALERLYTYRHQKRISMISKEWIVFQVAQWVIMASIIKLVITLSHGMATFGIEISSWIDDFYTNFFDQEYLSALLIVILVWWISGSWADLLNEIMLPGSSRNYDFIYYRRGERPEPRERLIGSIFTIGVGLVALTALLRSDLRAIIGDQYGSPVNKLPYLAGGGGNVLLFFILGFALIGMSKYAVLSAEWNASRVMIRNDVPVKWALYSLLFLITLSILISFLPTAYSLDLFSSLVYLFKIIINILVFLFGVVIFLSVYIFSLVGSLFGEPMRDFEPPPIPTIAPDLNITPTSSLPWLDLLKTLIFWATLIGIIFFSIKQYIGQHREVLKLIKQFPGFRYIQTVWRWIIGLFRGWNHQIVKFVDENLKKMRPRISNQKIRGLPAFLRIRGLSPRQRVIFFFMALIRRAGKRGMPRGISQTPYEYSEKLQTSFPEIVDEISIMTDYFVEARYSQHEVEDDEANIVKRYWKQIRKALSSSLHED